MQQQFIFKESTNTSLALGFELEEYLETLGYTDRTGDDVRYTNDGGAGETYQLVPLTGTEIWAAYRGSLNPNNESGAPPFQRERWSNPGQWMEETLPSDETQFDVNLTDGKLSTSPETIESTLQVVNRGPKPHPVWVVVEAKPVSASWDDPLAVTLYEKPVFVGVGEPKEVDIQTPPPTQAGEWEVRARLTSYPPSVVESIQLLGELTAESTVTVETPTPTPTPTPSPTPPATDSPLPSVESDSPTSQPSNEGPGTPEETDSSPTVPGFGIPAVVVAFVLFGLLRRHR